MELLIHVHARFIRKADGKPLHGNHFRIRLFDKDPLRNDFLGETYLDHDGIARFNIDPAAYRGGDTPGEQKPDLFLQVLQNGNPVFTTPVAKNIDLSEYSEFNTQEGEQLDLGSFLVDVL